MSVAPASFAPFCYQKTLTRLNKVELKLVFFHIEDLRSNRYFHRYVLAVLSVTIRALAVASAARGVFRVVSKMEQRIKALVRFHPHAAANAAVTAARAAARHEFFAPKGRDADSAVASLDLDFYAVDEHYLF